MHVSVNSGKKFTSFPGVVNKILFTYNHQTVGIYIWWLDKLPPLVILKINNILKMYFHDNPCKKKCQKRPCFMDYNFKDNEVNQGGHVFIKVHEFLSL